MKILFINYEFPPLGGGGGVAAYHIARELAKKHEVDYLTSWHHSLKKEEVVDRINLYRVYVLARRELHTAGLLSLITFPFFGFFKGLRLCVSKKYDVINTHFAVPSGIVGVLLSKLFGIKNVLTIHGGDIYDPTKKLSPHRNFFLRMIVKFILNNSNVVVAQSSNTKENAIKYYRPTKNIKVIPLGFPLPTYKKITRKSLSLRNDSVYLISIGRLIKRKGYDYLLKALSLFHHPRIRLLLIGNGPEKDHLVNLATRFKIASNVHFLGAVSEEKKFQYLSNSDIYVLSSLHEGFGIVLMEAMFCGLPIVTTNIGGQVDLIKGGRNGILIDPEDSKALAGAITTLLNRRSLMHMISKNNVRDIKKYAIANIADMYTRVFKNELQK